MARHVPAAAGGEHEAAAAVQRAGRRAARPARPLPRPPGHAGGAGQPHRRRHRRRRLGPAGPAAVGARPARGRRPDAVGDVRRGPRRTSPTRTADTPLQPAVDAFLAEHGHRGNDEYELATPAWVMDPTPVYAAIDRLRHAPADRDPGRRRRPPRRATPTRRWPRQSTLLPRHLRWMARRCAMVSRQGSIGRERAKDILVLENLGARRVLHELVAPGRRAWRAGRRAPGLLRHGRRARRLRRPTRRTSPTVIAERAAAAALPRRAHPAAVVRRAHPRPGHVAAARGRPAAGARRRARPSPASPSAAARRRARPG